MRAIYGAPCRLRFFFHYALIDIMLPRYILMSHAIDIRFMMACYTLRFRHFFHTLLRHAIIRCHASCHAASAYDCRYHTALPFITRMLYMPRFSLFDADMILLLPLLCHTLQMLLY